MHKIQKNLSNARDYFREHLQAGDCCLAGQRIKGEWFGTGAENLSHEVRIEGENLTELLLELQASNVELLREIPDRAQQLSGAVIRAVTITAETQSSTGPKGARSGK